jgi:predicted transcriptional regulator
MNAANTKPTPITVRLPPELHQRIVELAKGDEVKRPPASVQDTYAWLLKRALKDLEHESDAARG